MSHEPASGLSQAERALAHRLGVHESREAIDAAVGKVADLLRVLSRIKQRLVEEGRWEEFVAANPLPDGEGEQRQTTQPGVQGITG